MADKKVRELKPIVCPYCGWQHEPSEVLFADSVIGRIAKNGVVRDGDGQIIYHEYEEDCEPLAEDVYYCDSCDRAFTVKIETNFTAEPVSEEFDFSDTSSSLL